jgi:hypothetical protein
MSFQSVCAKFGAIMFFMIAPSDEDWALAALNSVALSGKQSTILFY